MPRPSRSRARPGSERAPASRPRGRRPRPWTRGCVAATTPNVLSRPRTRVPYRCARAPRRMALSCVVAPDPSSECRSERSGCACSRPFSWASPSSPTAARRLTETVRIDGALDEPFWSRTPSIGRLLQQEPQPESEPTEETEVRVVYDSENLYFGILCRDREPSAIIATELARDP